MMASAQQDLQEQLKSTQTLMLILVALMVLTFLLVFWRTYNLGSSVCSLPHTSSSSSSSNLPIPDLGEARDL